MANQYTMAFTFLVGFIFIGWFLTSRSWQCGYMICISQLSTMTSCDGSDDPGARSTVGPRTEEPLAWTLPDSGPRKGGLGHTE